MIISNLVELEINAILNALGQPLMTQQELSKLSLLPYENFDAYSPTCQAIICVCLLYNSRGIPCTGKDLNYLQQLANENSCGISCTKLGYTNNKIYVLGGNSGHRYR